MRKEELLEELQGLVLELSNKRENFLENPVDIKVWNERRERVLDETASLSDADRAWINSIYGAWFKKHILPKHKDLAQKILNNVKGVKSDFSKEMKEKLKELESFYNNP